MNTKEKLQKKMEELVAVTITGDTSDENLLKIASISNEIVALAREQGKYPPMGANEQPENFIPEKKGRKIAKIVKLIK